MRKTFDEAEQVWARNIFDSYGYTVKDDDTFVIEEKLLSDGYCETCYFEYIGIEITNARTGSVVQIDMTFRDVVNEIVNAGEDDEDD